MMNLEQAQKDFEARGNPCNFPAPSASVPNKYIVSQHTDKIITTYDFSKNPVLIGQHKKA